MATQDPPWLAKHWRALVMALALGAPLVLLFSRGPIAQDQAYHAFAGDGPGWIPNLWNVLSNLPFLVVGVAGFLERKQARGSTRWAWKVFFAGTALVAFGSAYYHWAPNDRTLLWDRIPITLAFMALFVALVAEYVDQCMERRLLLPAILFGVGSVLWWRHSGDLRVYLGVQIGALLAIPVILAVFRPRFTHGRYLIYSLGFYVLAKVVETYDWAFFDLVAGSVGGHPVKHLLAAVGSFLIWMMLRRRGNLASA